MRQIYRRGRHNSTGGPPRRSRIGQAVGLAILGWSIIAAVWLGVEAIAWILELAA